MPFLFLAILAIVFGPQLWVWWATNRHARVDEQIAGTGGELAQHLIERFELEAVTVKRGAKNANYYSPEERVVSLEPRVFDQRSLTAVAIAAHEVGHAIQHARGETLMQARNRYWPAVARLRKFGVVLLTIVPVLLLIMRVPGASVLMMLGGFCAMAGAVVFHLLTLPMEIDASFKKAMPVLIKGDYISEQQRGAVREVLAAAAMTYVAAALADLLNIARWIAILR